MLALRVIFVTSVVQYERVRYVVLNRITVAEKLLFCHRATCGRTQLRNELQSPPATSRSIRMIFSEQFVAIECAGYYYLKRAPFLCAKVIAMTPRHVMWQHMTFFWVHFLQHYSMTMEEKSWTCSMTCVLMAFQVKSEYVPNACT